MNLDDYADSSRSLIRDRDAEFTMVFDAVLAAAGIGIITTRVQAHRAKAIAERWTASARRLNVRVLRRDRLGGLVHEYSQVALGLGAGEEPLVDGQMRGCRTLPGVRAGKCAVGAGRRRGG